jgi:ABC-2 type transport system permease protein
MRAILALAQKDLLILVRTRTGVFFTFIWPLLVAIFFGLIFSGSNTGSAKIPVVVVDEDGTAGSRAFITHLQEGGNLDIIQKNRDEATALVKHGKRTAAVVFPKGFGTASEHLFYGDPPKLEILIDPSRKAETGMIEGLLLKQAAENMQHRLSDRTAYKNMVNNALGAVRQLPDGDATKPALNRFLSELDQFVDANPVDKTGRNGMANWQPLEVATKDTSVEQQGPRNSFDITFPQGILWGIIGCCMTFGIGIVSERTHGTMVRLQMSPLSRAHLLVGKALACFAGILGVEAGLFAFGRIFFHVRPASWVLLVLAGLSTAIAFVGIMMLTSTLGKTEQAAAGAGWAVMMPLSMFGGGMVPLMFMPGWMANVSNFSPVKWALLAMEGAIWRGFSLREMLFPCALLVGIGIACFAIGVRTFRAD